MALVAHIVEELAKKGYKVEKGLDGVAAKTVDALAARAQTGSLDIKSLGRVEKTAIREMTDTLIVAMKKTDATGATVLSKSAVRDLEQAYTSASIKEFGRGASAEAAVEEFRKTIADAWKESRADTRSLTRPQTVEQAAPSVNRVEARVKADDRAIRAAKDPAPNPNPGIINPQPGDFYPAGARRQPTAPPAQSPVAPAAAPTPNPHDHGGHATSEEIAAKARVEAENKVKIVGDTFGARSDVTKGLREFDEGGFAQKKAAFDKVSSAIEGSGLIARPGSAEAAKFATTTGNARSLDEVKGILLSRPGMDADNKFIDGVISVNEWTALRKSMRSDLLQSEQQMIFSRVDQARLGDKRIDTMSTDMARLREIMLDKDFNPAPRLNDQGRVLPDSHRMSASGLQAAQSGKPRSDFKAIEADLREGKPVAPNEIDKLSVSYKRWYASTTDQKAESSSPGRVGQAIDAVGRGANAVFRPVDRHLDRVPGLPRVAPVVGGLAGTFLLASALSVPVTYFSPDNEVPLMGDLGRRVATNLPFGFAGNVPGASWLPEIYFSKMESDADFRAKVMSASPDEIAHMNSSKQQARTVLVERANTERDKRAEGETSKKGLIEQSTNLGATKADIQVAQRAAGTYVGERGASADDIKAGLSTLYKQDTDITADQLDKMAEELAKKGSTVTKQEFDDVVAANKSTGAVPVTGYQQLEKILGPKLTP